MTSAGASNNSAVGQLTSGRGVGPVKGVSVKCPPHGQCQLTWKEAEGASGYRIKVLSSRPYPKIPLITLYKTTSYHCNYFYVFFLKTVTSYPVNSNK